MCPCQSSRACAPRVRDASAAEPDTSASAGVRIDRSGSAWPMTLSASDNSGIWRIISQERSCTPRRYSHDQGLRARISFCLLRDGTRGGLRPFPCARLTCPRRRCNSHYKAVGTSARLEEECPDNSLGTAIAHLSCTGGLKNGVEPNVLGSLAPGKGFHNAVEPLFFCTPGRRAPSLADVGRAVDGRYERREG